MLNLNRLAASATVAALTLGVAFAGQPNQKADAQTPSGFYVCNESGETLNVSLAYYNSDGTWTTTGLNQLDQTLGSCEQIRTASLDNTRYYLYATAASGHVWQGNHPFCFNSLNIPTLNATNGSCNIFYGESVGNFFSVWIPDPVTGNYPSYYAYTFAPNNYVINWNSPRAER